MRSFLSTLYRQRRRLGLALLAIHFYLLTHAGQAFPDSPAWIIAATLLIMVPILLVPLALFILTVPSLRIVIEVIVVHTAVMLALQLAVPGLFDLFEAYQMGFLIWLVTFLTVNFAMYGTLLDGLPAWFSYTGRARFRTTAPAQDVYAAYIPGPRNNEKYRSGTLEYLGPDDDDPESYTVRYGVGEGLYEMQKITPLEDFQPPHRARYYFLGDVTSKNMAFAEGVFDLTITEQGNGTRLVEVVEEHPALRLRTALALWFDDHTGDTANSVRAKVERKHDFSMTGRFWRRQAKLV